METVHFYILAGLSGISLALCAILLYRVKNVIYLLEQPVVKKMSPQLKLKPVKIDELDEETRRNNARNNPPNGAPMNRPPRPAIDREPGSDRGRDQNRDRLPRHERERSENGADRNAPRGDRNDRDGRFRDRDRNGRHDRNERHGGDRDRSRPRPDVFTNEKEGGEAAPLAPRPVPAMGIHEHSGNQASSGPALSPRRPLPSTVDQEVNGRDLPPINDAGPMSEADAAFVGRDDSDIQHGRRHQPKKKPRFDVGEEEPKASPEEFKA